ncbi:MAG: PspC domain-containing protein [Arachnia sp.]
MKLTRSTDDKCIAGVASGIARAAGIDPTIVRAVFAVSLVLGGVGIWVYVILWAVIPRDTGGTVAEEGYHKARQWYAKQQNTPATPAPTTPSGDRSDDYSV